MKTVIFWVATLTIFGTVNAMIAQKESAIRNGTTMFVELGPRDPRSLMQGDYMVLRYRMPGAPESYALDRRGRFVVRLDDKKVAHFVRVDQGGELGDGEHLLRYTLHRSGNRIQFGADSYFFQEGHGRHNATARFGELKVADSGESILVGLRNADLSEAGPK
jgi:uncharacterized membrane-anchored protein